MVNLRKGARIKGARNKGAHIKGVRKKGAHIKGARKKGDRKKGAKYRKGATPKYLLFKSATIYIIRTSKYPSPHQPCINIDGNV